MSDYQGIKGVKVKAISADPTNVNLGDVWYNSTSNTFKARIYSSGWASGNNLLSPSGPSTRNNGAGGGADSSCFMFGGSKVDAPYTWTNTQNFDGTSWANSGEYLWGWQGNSGTGTAQSTGIGFTGYQRPGYPPIGDKGHSATYNGSSWTAVNDLPTVGGGCVGTGNSSLAMAWCFHTNQDLTCEWDGTCWTDGANHVAPATGTNAKGQCGPKSNCYAGGIAETGSETWNDTCWTTAGTVTACKSGGAAGSGSTAGLVWGKTPVAATTTSAFDGTSWSAKGALVISSGDYTGAGGNSATAAWTSGGAPMPTAGLATQLYSEGGATQTITTS